LQEWGEDSDNRAAKVIGATGAILAYGVEGAIPESTGSAVLEAVGGKLASKGFKLLRSAGRMAKRGLQALGPADVVPIAAVSDTVPMAAVANTVPLAAVADTQPVGNVTRVLGGAGSPSVRTAAKELHIQDLGYTGNVRFDQNELGQGRTFAEYILKVKWVREKPYEMKMWRRTDRGSH
jgi:hypothetical protein